MSTLVVMGYNDRYTAEEVRLKLRKLQREYLIDLEDAVVAVKDTDGKVLKTSLSHEDERLPLAGGFVGAGASAFYLKQFTGDCGSGARLGGFEAETFGVGPTLSCFRQLGKMTLVADASSLPQLHSNTTTRGNYWWLKLTLAF